MRKIDTGFQLGTYFASRLLFYSVSNFPLVDFVEFFVDSLETFSPQC